MRFLVLLLALGGLLLPQAAGAATATVPASADVGLPFWCDWGYDWDERCYTDNGPRLPVGGVDDKVWRAALRFPLGQIPAGATITSAEVRLVHDRACVAPRRRSGPCEGGSYWLDAHRIVSADWFDERELEFDERVAGRTTLFDSAAHTTLSLDVTALVRVWQQGLAPNNGLLVRLTEWQEGYDVSGPAFPSSSFADAAARPRLVVTYTPPSG
ncbi:MAG: DNRLRE domain-containing protein [Thermoleophilaceae bacterium]